IGCWWDWEWVPSVAPAALVTIGTNFHLTRQLDFSYWHSSNCTEKTAFLLRCFCRRKVAFAVLVADEVNFEPIAGSPPAKGDCLAAVTAGVPGTVVFLTALSRASLQNKPFISENHADERLFFRPIQ